MKLKLVLATTALVFSSCAAPQPAFARGMCSTAVHATWPVDQAKAIRVCNCESHGVPTADNPSSSARGLFQIINSTWRENARRGEHRDNPYDNAAVAYRIRKRYGWSPWAASRHCWS